MARSEAPEGSPVRRPIAVVVSRFPKVTETFVLREICEMERQGQAVRLVTLLRERPGVVHSAARPWLERLLHVPFLSLAVLVANARRWSSDGKLCAALARRILAATWRRPAVAIRSLAVFAQAVAIAERLDRERVGHIHAQFATYPATAAWVIGRLTGIGYSFTVHAHDLFVHQMLLREKIEAARFVRTISEFNRARLIELAPDAAEKVEVIPVGVDTRLEAAPESADRRTPLILSVAALEEYKGLEVLIAACGRLRSQGQNFRCRIVGRGRLRARLEAQIRASGLQDAVELAGAQTESDVGRSMRSASVVVQPSVVARDGQMEGIPVALMEALRARRPVVASRLSGIPELVSDGVHGLLVPPGDPEALAAALRRLLDDPRAADEMARRGRERVRERFDLERNTSQLLDRLDDENPADRDSGLLVRAGLGGRASRLDESRRTDSEIRRLLVASESGPRELISKRHCSRRGESAPPEVRAENEFRVLEALREEASPVLRVPRVLAFDRARAELLLEVCAGEPLDARIRRWRRDPTVPLVEDLRAVGTWLSAFHARSSHSGSAAGRIEGMLDEIEHGLLLQAGLSIPEAERCRARSGRLVEAFERTSPREVTIHGDFWPGNVFVDSRGVEVIDFEGTRSGLAEEDIANFLVELRLFFQRPGLAPAYSGCAREFLRGLGGTGASGVEFCAVYASLRMLCAEPDSRTAHWKRWWRRRLLSRTAVSGGVLQ